MANQVIINPGGGSGQITVNQGSTGQGQTSIINVVTAGPSGPPGPSGSQGDQGPQGPQGANGADGVPFTDRGQNIYSTTASLQLYAFDPNTQQIVPGQLDTGDSAYIKGIGINGTDYDFVENVWSNGIKNGVIGIYSDHLYASFNDGVNTSNELKIYGNRAELDKGLTAASFTGSLLGTASYARRALTASYALNGGGTNIDTSSLATTGSNIFIGTQTVTGSLNLTGSITVVGGKITAPSFTGSLQGTSSWAQSASVALSANSVPLIQGPGITVNGLAITASVRTINSISPDSNGNIAVSFGGTVLTGTSASLILSSSGAITGSIINGTTWVISGDPDPDKNGYSYIFQSGPPGQWLSTTPSATSTYDTRYLKLTPQSALVGNLDLGGFNINNVGYMYGIASNALNANNADYATTAGSTTSALNANTAYNADNATHADNSSTADQILTSNVDPIDISYYLTFTNPTYSTPGDYSSLSTNNSIYYNPSEETLYASNFRGNLDGIAASANVAYAYSSNVLTITPQSPLPTGVPIGSFAVSSSNPPKPYFWDGISWKSLY